MRLDRLELVNFGSHRHTVLECGASRLIVLTGPNGVGKSTLASEAVGHALYKDSRGSIDSGIRNGQTDSAVSIDFTFSGQAYRAIRRRTSRGAGKSSADLQIRLPDGAWVPIASGDREVPAAVTELLRMDAATFRTCVSLAQRDLDRFVAATAAGRKEVLASIVVDQRFAPAAELARIRARDSEGEAGQIRARIARLDDIIAELRPVEEVRDRALADATRLDALLEERGAERDGVKILLEAAIARQAAAAAKAADVDRVEREVAALVDRYRTTKARHDASAAAIVQAEATLATAPETEEAIADLPAAKAELDRLLAAADENNRIRSEIAQQRIRVDDLDRPYQRELARWEGRHDAAVAKVEELVEHGKAQASVCEACGQPIDQATALQQLAAARAARDALGPAPQAPLALAREEAALARLEARQRELGWDPDAMVTARDRVDVLTRAAARAESIEAAAATLERERAAVAAAAAELEEIGTAGAAARARLEELNAAAAAQAQLTRDVAATRDELARILHLVEQAEAERRDVGERLVRAEASLEQLAATTQERDDAAAAFEDLDVRIRRLRALAAAFGLKGIPARVIESVLPELGRHANQVLEQLFGMHLEIRARRATADGSRIVEALDLLVRKDDVGELELERISGGQATAVSLALAIGLSRLVARRAGTAIRTLVVDEPEGLDATRLRALGQALRTLAHQGELERVLVITHTAELAEYADLVVELRDGPDGVQMFIDGIRQEPAASTAAIAA